MPRPHYIICSESVSHDQITKRMSLFHVLEGFQIISTKNNQADDDSGQSPGIPARPVFMGVAVWMRAEDDDTEEVYEFETTATSPGSDEKVVQKGEFSFGNVFQRFVSGFVLNHPWKESGFFVYKSKIRRQGAADWLVQDFPIPIEVVTQGGNEQS